MSHPKHPGEVSARAPTVPSHEMHVLWFARSPEVCFVCLCGGEKGCCADCRICFQKDKPSRTKCWHCRTQSPQRHQENIDPLAQIGENATQLMATLPTRSHHRAPLLSILSTNIPSTIAASLLHASPSHVRNMKRTDHSCSDLLQSKYPAGVKRQRLVPDRVDQLCDFVAAACPTKSGERSESYHQYTTDASLYSAYCQSAPTPVSFNTFYRVKRWMRVRRAGRYLGQFDCSRCVTFHKLQHKPEAELTGEEAHDLRCCTLHRQTVFPSASTISRCGLIFSLDSS